MSTLVGHTQCVSSVVWPQQETIYSASWDHSVRLWDAETGKNSSDIVSATILQLSLSFCFCLFNSFRQFIAKFKNKFASLSVVGMRGRVFGYQNFLKWAYIELLKSMLIEITDY